MAIETSHFWPSWLIIWRVPNDWLQAGETARRLGVSRETIRLWANSGRLPHERTSSGTLLFDVSVVDARRSGDAGVEMPWPAVLIKPWVWSRLNSWDGLETGGFLYGHRLPERLVVESLVKMEDADRSSRHIDLDLRRGLEYVDAQGALLGDFHTHPPEGDRFASTTDRRAWARTAATFGHIWLGLVVREPESRTSEDDVTCYLASPSGEVEWHNVIRLDSLAESRGW